MWNTNNYDFAKHLVITHSGEYPYYIAVTNTYVGSGYSSNYPNFYVYLSKKPISARSRYSYTIPAGSLRYSVISNSANNTYNDERVSVSNISSVQTLNINDYEFCYTNAEFETASVQPDFLTTENVSQSTFNGVFIALLIVLIGIVTFRLVRS